MTGGRVAVVGVGLIGGSIGLAARERLGASVRGWDPDPGTLREAVDRGALDEVAEDLGSALAGAELAFVAAPVGALPEVVAATLAVAPSGCAVTDAGSTKRALVAACAERRFVGGHPLAGAETAGVRHARADLFDGATWYLTPTEHTEGVIYERVHRAVTGLGAQPTAIEAATHDQVLAAVSHLPHVLANVLVAQAASSLAAEDESLLASGPSFRDATRVAGANSAIWTDIYRSNADALIERIDDTVTRLGEVRSALAAGEPAPITAWNEDAASARRRLLEADLGGGEQHELRVSVPNEPGVVARIALELGRAGVNIGDMALYPAPDNRSGVVALWVTGPGAAQRATELLTALDLPVAPAAG